MASLHNEICDAVVTKLKTLTLTDIATTSIVKRRIPYTASQVGNVVLPGIVVCPIGMSDFQVVMTGQDDIGLPVLVAIQAVKNASFSDNPERELLWREQVLSALRYQRLTGIEEIVQCLPAPAPIYDVSLFANDNLWYSPLYFKYVTRTLRG